MKKILALMVLAAALLTGVVGCGDKKDEKKTGTATSTKTGTGT